MEKGPEEGLVELVRPEGFVQKVGAHFSLSLLLIKRCTGKTTIFGSKPNGNQILFLA